MVNLLNYSEEKIRKEACYAISNLMSNEDEIIKPILKHEIFVSMAKLLLRDTVNVKIYFNYFISMKILINLSYCNLIIFFYLIFNNL